MGERARIYQLHLSYGRTCFRAAKRLSKEFERRKLAPLSLKRAKSILAGVAGYDAWTELAACVRDASSAMDRELPLDLLYKRRNLQIERLSSLARIDKEVARNIVCSAEPTGYASGALRRYLQSDAVELRIHAPVVAAGIDNIFPAFKETLIDDLPPISLDWLRDETLPDDIEVRVTEVEYGIVTVQFTWTPPEGATCTFTAAYYRHMAVWLEDDEDYPLKPTKIYKLYADFRLREANFRGALDYRAEMQKAAAAFVMFDVALSAFTTVERAELAIPIVHFEVDVDRGKPETLALGEAIADAFSAFMEIEAVDDEITAVVPFDMITVDDIHVD